MNRAIIQGTFLNTLANSDCSDRAIIIYANPFIKLRISMVMDHVTEYLHKTGDMKKAAYIDEGRRVSLN